MAAGDATFKTTAEHLRFFLKNSLDLVSTNQPGAVVTSFAGSPEQGEGDLVLCAVVVPRFVQLIDELHDDLQTYIDGWFADHGFAKDRPQ